MTSTTTDLTITSTRPDGDQAVDVTDGDRVLRALADPMRAAIVALLAREQLCTCHLQDSLPAKQALVSHHLRLLREAGLVVTEPCGRFTYYRLAPGAFDAGRDLLAHLSAAADSAVPKRPC